MAKHKAKLPQSQQNAGVLYPSINSNPTKYRPRLFFVGDTSKAICASSRLEQVGFARNLFSSCSDLGGALLQKAAWVAGPGTWKPIYTGDNKVWGDIAEDWLNNQFYPVCSVMGANYPFSELLYITSLALDVDGDNGLYFTSTRSGFPQVGLIASHRIGNRWNDKVVESGKFSGYKLEDGCIINDIGRVIGYRILGDTKDDDYDISTQSFQLLFEPEWGDLNRGISRIARSVEDWADSDDISEYLKRQVKLASSIGLMAKTESGTNQGTNIVGLDEEVTVENKRSAIGEYINGGEIRYMKSGANETLELLNFENPSPNTAEFLARIQKKAMYAVGWPQELLDPSKIGGGSVRLIQDITRRIIAKRQATLERRAKTITSYAIARAMNIGLIPQNNIDWFSFNFTKGPQLTVDNGNEAAADREALKLGITTLAEVAAKSGQDWYELRTQQQRETEDLLTRAQGISIKFKISMDAALALLSQRTPNQAPVVAPVADNQHN